MAGPPAGKSLTIRQALRKSRFPQQLPGGPPDVCYSVSDQRLVVYLAPFSARRHQSRPVPFTLDAALRPPPDHPRGRHSRPRAGSPPRGRRAPRLGGARLRPLADRPPARRLGTADRGRGRLAAPYPRRLSPASRGPYRLLPSPTEGLPDHPLLLPGGQGPT